MELKESNERILASLAADAEVLDVGGWSKPFSRATWVIDLQPYATRGYGDRRYSDAATNTGDERFTAATWVERDICDRDPWPFADDQFDFAVCAQTLEDIRDPIWVCEELSRVAKAGYVEVPTRLEEQCWGMHGPWVGWSHHRWLIDVDGQHITFVHKPAFLQARPAAYFPAGFAQSLTPAERSHAVWWEDSIEAHERVMLTPEEADPYIEDFVAEELQRRGRSPARPPEGRLGQLVRRLRGR